MPRKVNFEAKKYNLNHHYKNNKNKDIDITPKTGDEMKLWLIVGIMVLVLGVGIITIKKIKQNRI